LTGKQRILRRKEPICKSFILAIIYILTLVTSWVRVYEVGSECIADAGIDMAKKEYTYWKEVHKVVLSNPKVLRAHWSFWERPVEEIKKSLVDAEKKVVKAYIGYHQN